MSVLSNMASALARHFSTEVFGENATYIEKGTNKQIPVNIVLGLDDGEEINGADDPGQVNVVGLQLSEVPQVVVSSKLMIPGSPAETEWRIMNARLHGSKIFWKCEIHRL